MLISHLITLYDKIIFINNNKVKTSRSDNLEIVPELLK